MWEPKSDSAKEVSISQAERPTPPENPHETRTKEPRRVPVVLSIAAAAAGLLLGTSSAKGSFLENQISFQLDFKLAKDMPFTFMVQGENIDWNRLFSLPEVAIVL